MSSDLESAVGYRFSDGALLEAALVHRSYTAENATVEDNERFEFLGDAVLQLAATDYLFGHYPDLREGQLAKIRAACVNKTELATIARRWGVGPHLKIGVGEETSGGRTKDSILADAVEAILAAVYLDGGYEAAKQVVLTHWIGLIREKAVAPGRRDFKTRLQEILAADGRRPDYQVADRGPDHAKEFTATVYVDGAAMGTGVGRSKKEAQQEAARAAIDALER